MNYLIILIFTFYFCTPQYLVSQAIPKNYLSFQTKKFLFDAGKNWDLITNFNPIRYSKHKTLDNDLDDRSSLKSRLGFLSLNENTTMYSYTNFSYDKFYLYSYSNFLNKESRELLSKNKSKIKNFQDNISGLGYQNNWLNIQFGSGQEGWGAGDETQLALNENSASYDYFLLNSDYGNIRVNYIYGYLESVPDSINRFITARGLEWSNKEDFLIGFSETVIYSGINRSFDIGYLNPLSSHLEIELNNRLNVLGSANSNAVWQIHIDYLITDRIRFSGNYLYDEVVIDPDLEKGKENGTAYSYRIAYTPIVLQKNMVTFYFTSIYVGTPTFRHASGMNNFVHKSRPIGTLLGSDTKDIFLGLNYTNSKNLILLVKGGVQSSGEENILNRPYSTYKNFQKGVFPSGLVDKAYYLNTYFRYFWNDYFSFSFDCNLSKNQKNNFLYDFIFSLNLSRELSFKF